MIKSVGDFLNIINELYPENGEAFFRGQSSSEFDVSSSLCRFIFDCDKEMDNFPAQVFSSDFFEKFKNKFPAYPESSFLKNYSVNKIDILMTAQHYGMPTRLIDWSKNPLIALYFATERTSNFCEYASVFILKGTEESKLKVKNSKSIIDGLLYDKNAMLRVYNCIKENEMSFLEHSEYSASLDVPKCCKNISKMSNEIREIKKNSLFNCNYHNILDLHDGKQKDFPSLINRIINDFIRLEQVFCNDPRPVVYKEAVYNIQNELNAALSNHAIDPVVSNLYGNDHIMIEPLPINVRIKNQQGYFLFSKKNECPEFRKEDFEIGKNIVRSQSDINDELKNECIVRIDLDANFSETIKKELSRYGVSKSFVYPELPSFTEEVKNSILSEYEHG